MKTVVDFLDELEALAGSAQRAELDLRRDVAAEIALHERERQFAFRRLDLARTMVRAAQGAEGESAAIGAQLAALRAEFGWHGDSAERRGILEAWRRVARAVARSLGVEREDGAEDAGEPEETVRDAMLAFESWYRQTLGSEFLALLDHEIPEMPVVEF